MMNERKKFEIFITLFDKKIVRRTHVDIYKLHINLKFCVYSIYTFSKLNTLLKKIGNTLYILKNGLFLNR